MSHITGWNGNAKMRCKVMALSPQCGNRPSAALINATKATATSSVATIPTSTGTPSMVPLTMASSALIGGSVMTRRSSETSPGPNGTNSAAMASAAGVLMTEAIRMLPNAFGTIGARNDA